MRVAIYNTRSELLIFSLSLINTAIHQVPSRFKYLIHNGSPSARHNPLHFCRQEASRRPRATIPDPAPRLWTPGIDSTDND